MKRVPKVLSYIMTALLSCLLTLAIMLFALGYAPANKLVELQMLIDQCFIGEVDRVAVEDAAAHAMIGALGDRWSYYIPASEYEAYQADKNNAYVGVGITVQQSQDGNGLLVTAVAEGGPALEAGILAGDVITAVGDVSLKGMPVEQAGNQIRGPEGTEVLLTVLREGEERNFTVKLRQIQVTVAKGQLLDNKIGLVTINNFNTNCYTETHKAITELLEQGAEKLIFDVRFNGGGFAEEMVDVLDYLLPEGQVFRTENYTGKETVYTSDENCLNMPMAVLVNGSSYSAAECFAAALREFGVATVVGEKTSGKGYFQVVFELSDGSAVGLSIGKYYTPHDNNLEGIGLEPDISVAVDQETAAAIYAGTLAPADDPQIAAAVNALLSGK